MAPGLEFRVSSFDFGVVTVNMELETAAKNQEL